MPNASTPRLPATRNPVTSQRSGADRTPADDPSRPRPHSPGRPHTHSTPPAHEPAHDRGHPPATKRTPSGLSAGPDPASPYPATISAPAWPIHPNSAASRSSSTSSPAAPSTPRSPPAPGPARPAIARSRPATPHTKAATRPAAPTHQDPNTPQPPTTPTTRPTTVRPSRARQQHQTGTDTYPDTIRELFDRWRHVLHECRHLRNYVGEAHELYIEQLNAELLIGGEYFSDSGRRAGKYWCTPVTQASDGSW